MDTYVYRCGEQEHRLSVSTYDSHLLVLANPPALASRSACQSRSGPGQAHPSPPLAGGCACSARPARSRRLPPSVSIFAEGAKLGRRRQGARRWKARVRFWRYDRPRQSSPGFCALTTSLMITLDEATSDRLIAERAMRQNEEARLSGVAPTAVQTTVVHDLRDMRPVRLDDGRTLQAERRSHRTDIAADVRLLVEYLSRVSGDVVEVRVEEGRG